MDFDNMINDSHAVQDEITDLDVDSPDIANKTDDGLWELSKSEADGKGTEYNWLDNNVDQSQLALPIHARLVSSEEDLISPTVPLARDLNSNNPFLNQIQELYKPSNWSIHKPEPPRNQEFPRDSLDDIDVTPQIPSNNLKFSQSNYSSHSYNDEGFACDEIITIGSTDQSPNDLDGFHANIHNDKRSIEDIWGLDMNSYNYNGPPTNNNSNGFTKEQMKLSPKVKELVVGSVNGTHSKQMKAVQDEADLCHCCHKKVYITERVAINQNSVYHKQCLKCTKCHRLLNINNFALCGQLLFCQNHFIELFRQKDNAAPDVVPSNHKEMLHNNNNSSETIQPMKTLVEKFSNPKSVQSNSYQKKLSANSMKEIKVKPIQQSTNQISPADEPANEMPAPGFTRNMLSLWSNMTGSKVVIRGTLSLSHLNKDSAAGYEDNNVPPDDSVARQHQSEVVKHDDKPIDNLPPSQITKCVVAKFRGLLIVLHFIIT